MSLVWLQGSVLQTGGGDGGGVAANIEVLHEASVVDPIPVLYAISATKQANTPANTAALKALTSAVFTVNGIDSAIIRNLPSILDGGTGLRQAEVIIQNALSSSSIPDTYTVSLTGNSSDSVRYFHVENSAGDVGTLSGNLVTAMGLDTFTEVSYMPKSAPILLEPSPSGYWNELNIFSIFLFKPSLASSDRFAQFKSIYISDGENVHTWVSSLSNSGIWSESSNSNPRDELHHIGRVIYGSPTIANFYFNPLTGEITWDNPTNIVPNVGQIYKIQNLLVIGKRGA